MRSFGADSGRDERRGATGGSGSGADGGLVDFRGDSVGGDGFGAFGFVSFVGGDFGWRSVRCLRGFEHFPVCRRFLHCDGDAEVEFARADCVASGKADRLASAGFGGRVYVGGSVFVDVDIQYGDGVDDVADCVGGRGDGGEECGRPGRRRLCGLRSFGNRLCGEHRRGGYFDWDAAERGSSGAVQKVVSQSGGDWLFAMDVGGISDVGGFAAANLVLAHKVSVSL